LECRIAQGVRLVPAVPADVGALLGRGRGVAVGAQHEVAQVDVDVALGSVVDVDVDQDRSLGRVRDPEPRLLARLAQRRVLGELPAVDVTARLEPPVEAAVQVQHRAPATDDDCRRCHVREVRARLARVRKPLELPGGPLDRCAFPLIGRPMGGNEGPQPLGVARVA